MESIVVKNNEETLDGKKVRYINYKNEDYMIFTLEEIDKDKYQKLYISKIVDNKEEFINDKEWEDLKKEIPNIVKQIKNNNMTDVMDLDMDSIETIDMNCSRAFKLKEKIVKSIIKQKTIDTIKQIDEDLKSITEDVDELENKESNETENSEVDNNVENSSDNKKDEINNSEEQKNSSEDLEAKVAELEEKVKKYEEIIEKIKIMVNES